MFKTQRELLLTNSFFHEATNQIQKVFSSSTIYKLQKDNDELEPEDKPLTVIFYMFCKNFSKMYIIRVAFMVLTAITSKKFKLADGILRLLYSSTFNISNFKTSLFIGLIPAINDLIHKFAKDFTNINTKSSLFIFLSGFIAAYIGISNDGVSDLMRFIILSILGRVIHSLISIICIRNNIPVKSKVWSYFIFSSICTIFNCFSFYVPDFKPIVNLFDKYGLYQGNEEKEFITYRSLYNIFKN